MALCSAPGSRFRSQVLVIAIFAFSSILGIGIGMILVDVESVSNSSTLQIFQAIAAGTLLYVTVCEVMPREKAKWHLHPRRYAGLSQCACVLIGFVTMTLLTVFMHD